MLIIVVLAVSGCSDDDSPDASGSLNTTADTISPERQYLDGLAVSGLSNHVTSSFALSVAEGWNAWVADNYLVWDGTYTPEQCLAAIPRKLGYLAGSKVASQPAMDTLTYVPSQTTDALGGPPSGRLYTVGVDVTFTDPVTGASVAAVRAQNNVVVLQDDTAKFIVHCN